MSAYLVAAVRNGMIVEVNITSESARGLTQVDGIYHLDILRHGSIGFRFDECIGPLIDMLIDDAGHFSWLEPFISLDIFRRAMARQKLAVTPELEEEFIDWQCSARLRQFHREST